MYMFDETICSVGGRATCGLTRLCEPVEVIELCRSEARDLKRIEINKASTLDVRDPQLRPIGPEIEQLEPHCCKLIAEVHPICGTAVSLSKEDREIRQGHVIVYERHLLHSDTPMTILDPQEVVAPSSQ